MPDDRDDPPRTTYPSWLQRKAVAASLDPRVIERLEREREREIPLGNGRGAPREPRLWTRSRLRGDDAIE
jgi:hypothetical protein